MRKPTRHFDDCILHLHLQGNILSCHVMVLRYIVVLFFLFVCLQPPASFAQDQPAVYLTGALNIMKLHAVNRASLPWDAIYKKAMDSVQGKKTNKETYPLILNAIGSLKDNHSKFFPPEVVADYLKRYKEVGIDFPYPSDSLIDGVYAYLTLPAIGNMNRPDWELYVSEFYKRAVKLDKNKLKAWIIDLRGNNGGMFAPMFAAIQPFLDQQRVIGSKDANGIITYYSCKGNVVYFGERAIDTIDIPQIRLKHKNVPVYILAGKKTSSSGEFVVASFAGQKNATIAGTATQGLTSDNSEFRLSDGAFLVLTTGNLVDRNQKEYNEIGKGIIPSLELKNDLLPAIIRYIKAGKAP